MKKHILTSIVFIFIAGCATTEVEMLNEATEYTNGACSVMVYPTKALAMEKGLTTEVCSVVGSSVPGWDHSLNGAIKKNIKKVCECGASAAYIQSQHTEITLGVKGVSHVTLIGVK